MKKILLLILVVFVMTGCSAAETFETLGQIQHQQDALPTMASIQLSLPESAAEQTFGGGSDTVYECEGYTLVLQTLVAGDFDRTVRTLSGFSPEKLTVMESMMEQGKRYDWVWTAAGESGDLVCRASVLDDGNYHYCIYTLAPAQSAGTLAEEWNTLFSSFCLGEGV